MANKAKIEKKQTEVQGNILSATVQAAQDVWAACYQEQETTTNESSQGN